MTEEVISQKIRLKKKNNKKTKEINNCFIREKDQHELMSGKNKKVSTTLIYIENFLTLAFLVTGHNSVSVFASSADIFTILLR